MVGVPRTPSRPGGFFVLFSQKHPDSEDQLFKGLKLVWIDLTEGSHRL